MATHVYVITSNTYIGDLGTLVGTVDGVPVTVNYWVSSTTGMTITQQKNFVAALMFAAAFPPQPVASGTLPGGTFTQ